MSVAETTDFLKKIFDKVNKLINLYNIRKY